MASEAHQAVWGDLTTSLRTREQAFRRRRGMTFFEWCDQHPDQGRVFAAGLSGLTLSEAAAIVAAYPFPQRGVVCDVAGGVGVVLGEVLRRRPELKGILMEAPLVLPEAPRYPDSLGVRERIELRAGNLFSDFHAVIDLYLMKWVLHDWGDDACIRILRTVAAAMPTGARLVVIEGYRSGTPCFLGSRPLICRCWS